MVWKGVPMKKLLFIVNPRAGKTKSRAPLFDAVAQFSRAGYLVRVYITEAGGQARDITARWGGQYDMVVCAGGDGTLNETLSGLMQLERRPLLGYLPCGSTNDFAMSLHLHTMRRSHRKDIASPAVSLGRFLYSHHTSASSAMPTAA